MTDRTIGSFANILQTNSNLDVAATGPIQGRGLTGARARTAKRARTES